MNDGKAILTLNSELVTECHYMEFVINLFHFVIYPNLKMFVSSSYPENKD